MIALWSFLGIIGAWMLLLIDARIKDDEKERQMEEESKGRKGWDSY